MLFNRDSEHHGCGPAVERRLLPVLHHAPECRTFLPQFAERAVPLDVVGQECGSFPKTGPYGIELAAHVPAGVQAVVYEEIYRADLFEEPGQNPGAGPPVQPPAVFERFWYGYAPEPLIFAPQGRQVYAVECAAAVHLEGLQDKGRAHTVGHTGLQHYGRRDQTTQKVAKAGEPGVRGPARAERILSADVLQEPARVIFDLFEGRLVEDLGYATQVLPDIPQHTPPPCRETPGDAVRAGEQGLSAVRHYASLTDAPSALHARRSEYNGACAGVSE